MGELQMTISFTLMQFFLPHAYLPICQQEGGTRHVSCI